MTISRKPPIDQAGGVDDFIKRAADVEPPESKEKRKESEKLIQRSFYLTDKHIKAIGLEAVYSGIDKSEVIRKLVESLDTYKKL